MPPLIVYSSKNMNTISTQDNIPSPNVKESIATVTIPFWVLDWLENQNPTVKQLYIECIKADGYGNFVPGGDKQWKKLATKLKSENFRKTRKILESNGLFEFHYSMKGKERQWYVWNRQGIISGNWKTGKSKNKTTVSGDTPTVSWTQNPEIIDTQAFYKPQEDTPNCELDSWIPPTVSSDSPTVSREVPTVSWGSSPENVDTYMSYDPQRTSQRMLEGEEINKENQEQNQTTVTEYAVPLDATPLQNGLEEEVQNISPDAPTNTTNSRLNPVDSIASKYVEGYNEEELDAYFAHLRTIPSPEPILESFTDKPNPEIQAGQDLNTGWEKSPTNIPKEYLIKKEENQVEILTGMTTTLDATSSIDTQEEECFTSSGEVTLSDSALNEQLAYWNSLNNGIQPTIESIGLEPHIEAANETIGLKEESSKNNLTVGAAPLEATQQLTPWQIREIVEFNKQLENGYQWYQIPDTDMVAALPLEDYQCLNDTARQYCEENDLDFDCWQFIEYQKELALNFLQELKTFGINIKIVATNALEAFVQARKAYAMA